MKIAGKKVWAWAACLACGSGVVADEPAPPTPPAGDPFADPAVVKAMGWRDLTGPDYKDHWRAYKSDQFPGKGWRWAGNVLAHDAQAGGGDLVTREQFEDFDLEGMFQCAPQGNSGIMYRVQEAHDAPWMTGPEYQVLDDIGQGLARDHKHSAGGMYDLFAPPKAKPINPGAHWNKFRIVLRQGVVQHWLNDAKVVEARLFDDEGRPDESWLGAVAASKFKDYAGFGLAPRGHIALQDHGDLIQYWKVRVRDLSAPMPGEVPLFNGRDLEGWVPVVPEAEKAGIEPADVWEVRDGILVCKGNPAGYIRTEGKHQNFLLRLQWRFNPQTKQAGNSGVLLRLVGEDKVWPKSVEAQLFSGRAGDFWNIDDVKMKTAPDRTKGRNTRHTHPAERAVGEWNEYEILVNKGDVVVKVNGEELNRAWDVEEVPGHIALQSEGAEIQFRNIRLVPLP